MVFGAPRVLSYVLKTPYPMASITSSSMWPILHRGDLVLIKGVSDKSELALGDIVVYSNSKGFTIHRVIQLNETTLITKGDANNSQDTPVEYSEVVGKALTIKGKLCKVPLLGNISLMINKPNS